MMKLSTLSVLLLMSAPVLAAPDTTEQQLFGNKKPAAEAATAPAEKTEPKPKSESSLFGGKKPADKKNNGHKLDSRSEAKLLYNRFDSGDMLYAIKLKEAANAGNPWAAMQYGYLAHKGRLPGMNQPDYALAQRAYLKAVKGQDGSLTGNYLAAYNLGVLYFRGGGPIKKDTAAALRWFQTAIVSYRELRKNKNAIFWPASAYVAQILTNGYGIKPDKTAARPYWKDALKGNEPVVLHGFAEQIYAENPFVAINYYQRSANLMYVPSMIALTRWYANSDQYHQADATRAASWLLNAARYDAHYRAVAEGVMARLDANQQKKARTAASSWLRIRGLRPVPFNYESPLNDDPVMTR